MANYKEVDETLSLVKDFATTEQIQDLLRTRRESVRITGENKDQIVDRNLRDAIDSRAIDIEKVFDLIRDAEENGAQHIFFYKAKSRAIADALAFENVAPRMFGTNWKKKLDEDFPQIKLKPNDFKISDFRQLENKPKDWILKVYGQTIIEKLTTEQEPEGTTALWRKFKYESLRIVLMARWNSPDLLEIRVQRDTSRRRVEGWHDIVWEKLTPSVMRRQFDPWPLSKIMANVINRQAKNKTLYNFRGAKLGDGIGNHATFETDTETGNLFASNEMTQSLESLATKHDPEGLVVTWFPQKNDTPSKEMRTLLGIKQLERMRNFVGEISNEIIVPAHCLARDLDYVTAQLRSFSK
ncbi:MAG: hypothetical protein LC794_01625 [Acidobacteria bacterium]|nr:hypothetical protein [Acidobacteriota bacterium]